MITLMEVLQELGSDSMQPGYWTEVRYMNDRLEIQLFYRNRDKDIVIKRIGLFTEKEVEDGTTVSNWLWTEARKMKKIVKSKEAL